MSTVHASELIELDSSHDHDAALDDLTDATADQLVDELERSWNNDADPKVAVNDTKGEPVIACVDGEIRFLVDRVQIPRIMSRSSFKTHVQKEIPEVVRLSETDYLREDFETEAVHVLSVVDKLLRCAWCGDRIERPEECVCYHLVDLAREDEDQ